MVDPTTPSQWQEAVDAAEGALTLCAARSYGLVTGGPVVDEARCLEILNRGAKLNITPTKDAIEKFIASLIVGTARARKPLSAIPRQPPGASPAPPPMKARVR